MTSDSERPGPTVAELAMLVYARGMPGTITTAAGVLPCVVTVLFPAQRDAEDDLCAHFGGFLTGPGPSDSMFWVGYGAAAVLALASIEALGIPAQCRSLDERVAGAWKALDTFATLWRTVPRDPHGRRPPEIHQQMMREQRRIARVMGTLDIYGPFMEIAEQQAAKMIESGAQSYDLLLPTDAEIAATVAGDMNRFEEQRLLLRDRSAELVMEIDPAELQAGIAALADLHAMAPDERERRIRRMVGEAAFNPEMLGAHIAHADQLFMGWAEDRWRNVSPEHMSEWAWRTINAYSFIKASHTVPTRAGPIDFHHVPANVLWALATAKLHHPAPPASQEEWDAYFSDGPLPAPPPSWEFEDLQARLTRGPSHHSR